MYLGTCLAVFPPESTLSVLVISQGVKNLLFYSQPKHMTWQEVQLENLDLTTLRISASRACPTRYTKRDTCKAGPLILLGRKPEELGP